MMVVLIMRTLTMPHAWCRCMGGFWAALLLILGANSAEAEVPENATASIYRSGWTCNAGYRKSDDMCLPVAVPPNAYATSGRYGRGWECRYGFREQNDRCLPVLVPSNAYAALIHTCGSS